MSWVDLNSDRNSAVSTQARTEGDGAITIRSTQDVAPILERNLAQRNATSRRTPHGDMAQVARIPMVIIGELMRSGTLKGDAGDAERLKKWLNDPDHRAFRTREGRV